MLSILAENNNQHSFYKKAGSFLYFLSVQMENEPTCLYSKVEFLQEFNFFIGTWKREGGF